MQRIGIVLTLFLFVCIGFHSVSVSVQAQSQAVDGTIEGFVKLEDASNIAGAKIRAVNQNTGYARDAISDVGGRYALPLLLPGTYSITVEKEGFPALSRKDIEVSAGQVITLEFVLSTTKIADAVEVTAQVPLVETGRTVISNTYEERVVRSLPTVGRSILDFFVLQPGVNARPLSTGGSGTGTPTTTYGGLGLRQMNVDGVSNNLQGGARNLVISQEAIQEFQTVTNFSAEFGRVGGGLQNAFTRSGGNAWHGSGYLFTRQKFLSAKPFLLAPTAPKPEFSRYNFGGTASGPVIKDKAFFFVSYERWVQDLPGVSTITPANATALNIPNTSIGAINQTFRAHTITARFDAQLNENNRLFTRYNYYFDRESPLGSGQQSLETLARFDEAPHSMTAQLVTSFSSKLINEARFLFATRGISNGVLNPDAPNINISGIASFNGNSNGTRVTREQGVQLIDNLSYNTGRHALKFGFDILPVKFRERTTNINGSFVFGGLAAVTGVRGAITPLDQFLLTERGTIDPATNRPYSYSRFTQSIGKEFFEAQVINHGYFMQDDLRVNDRLKLNVGIRYEFFQRPDGNLNPDLPATGMIPQDYNNIAPRVGFAWDTLGNARLVMRGGYGMYYNTTVAQTFNTFLRSNGREVININVTPTTTGAPAFTRNKVAPPTGIAVVSDVRVFADKFNDVTTHNFYLTNEVALAQDWALALTYQGTRGRNLPLAFNTNLAAAGTLPDGRRRWSTTNRPNPRYGNIFVSSSVGEQNYNGLVMTMTKRYSKGFSLQGAYHLSRTNGTAFADDFTGFGIFTSPSDPQDFTQDRGPGDFDMRHRFTLTGVWESKIDGLNAGASALLNGWQVSSRLIASSGYAFNATTGQDTNGDTIFNDRPTNIGYNAFSLPSYVTLDMRMSRFIKLGESRRLELIGEAFNLTNRLNPTNVVRVWGPNTTANANFRQVTQAESARQFQLAVRFSF